MDWEDLRARIKEFGLRHSTVSAIMPCESSSVIQNSTNGIEPVRKLLSYKKAKNGVLKQIVPNYHKGRKYYTLAFDMQDNNAIIKIIAVLQKFVGDGLPELLTRFAQPKRSPTHHNRDMFQKINLISLFLLKDIKYKKFGEQIDHKRVD